MEMLVGEMDTFEGLLLESSRKTPPGPAGVARETGNGVDWPGLIVTFCGTMIGVDCTVTLADAFG
jgi:hypothetical protein